MAHSPANVACFFTLFKRRTVIFEQKLQKTRGFDQIVRLLSDGCSAKTSDCVGSIVGDLFEKWRQRFESNAISEPKESIEHILAHSLGTTLISDVYKFRNKILTPQKVQEVNNLCTKRLEQLPVQYVLGECFFRKLTLKMSPPVFIPRPETEQLVEIVSKEIVRKKCTEIADLCCGSGAVVLALLQENPQLQATAVDKSEDACRLTLENAQKNGLAERLRIIRTPLAYWRPQKKFDVIVSNPPYIFSEDLEKLQPEIKLFEDLEALDGGAHGLDVIKIILELAARCLNENGKLFLEVEPRQPRLLCDYLRGNPRLGLEHVYADFFGKNRFVQIIK